MKKNNNVIVRKADYCYIYAGDSSISSEGSLLEEKKVKESQEIIIQSDSKTIKTISKFNLATENTKVNDTNFIVEEENISILPAFQKDEKKEEKSSVSQFKEEEDKISKKFNLNLSKTLAFSFSIIISEEERKKFIESLKTASNNEKRKKSFFNMIPRSKKQRRKNDDFFNFTQVNENRSNEKKNNDSFFDLISQKSNPLKRNQTESFFEKANQRNSFITEKNKEDDFFDLRKKFLTGGKKSSTQSLVKTFFKQNSAGSSVSNSSKNSYRNISQINQRKYALNTHTTGDLERNLELNLPKNSAKNSRPPTSNSNYFTNNPTNNNDNFYENNTSSIGAYSLKAKPRVKLSATSGNLFSDNYFSENTGLEKTFKASLYSLQNKIGIQNKQRVLKNITAGNNFFRTSFQPVYSVFQKRRNNTRKKNQLFSELSATLNNHKLDFIYPPNELNE